MARLIRHLQPWQKTTVDDDRLFEQLCTLSVGVLDEQWECWIEGAPGEYVVVVARADASPSEAPFRYNGPDDAVLRAFAKWLERHVEGPATKGPNRIASDRRHVSLTVIRDLGRPCPSCQGPFFEVEAREEGSSQPFRYARCSSCEYGERLAPEDDGVEAMATSEDGRERPSRVERIRRRALEIYEERIASGTPGDEMQDWVRAEAEIKDEPAEE